MDDNLEHCWVRVGAIALPNVSYRTSSFPPPLPSYAADSSCVKMTPDVSVEWETDDSLDTGRTMGQFISLPDGRLWMGNGAHLGTAGYGNESCA